MECDHKPHLYLRTLDPDREDSLRRIARWVGQGSAVLDVGCGPGILGRYLVETLGCTVDGVEYNPAAARLAAPWYRHLAIADLEQAYLPALFQGVRYDYIICADILEHLRNPERILVQAAKMFAAQGRLLLSVPNVAYAGLIAELLAGEFSYRPEGLLDETHLRFFTRQSLERWLSTHGFAICRQDGVTLELASSEFHGRLDRLPRLLQQALLAQPDALTYQVLVEARVASETGEIPAPAPAQLVDIIIPVYRGLTETRACLSSVLRSQQSVPHEIIVIDDASPEPALADYLRELAMAGRITLLRNAQNLGFVQTVNRGMALHEERDVVLLNSDTEVAGDWLDRLTQCAYSSPDIGTVTPFSNNATICSYPKTCADNALPPGYTVETLDALFRRVNSGQSIPIPTAVGFCMYIRRDCLRAVGPFDAAHFGRGYGEENDFCMRAAAVGWRHLLCGDVFVYHWGGASFGAERDLLQQQAIATLRQMHPGYEIAVQAHIAADPAKPLRQAIDAARLLDSRLPIVLFINHNLGGGTLKHVRELATLLSERIQTLVLFPTVGQIHALCWLRDGEKLEFRFTLPADYSLLCDVLRALNVGRIHFHHLLNVDSSIWQLPQDLRIPYDYTLHDYYPVCPRINLFNAPGCYCGEPDEAGCNRCLQTTEPVIKDITIQNWRTRSLQLLNAAERVFAPTQDVKSRMSHYSLAANLVFAPHPETRSINQQPSPALLAATEPLRIVVLGRLTQAKGADVLEACALDARQRDLPLTYHLLGSAQRDLTVEPNSRLRVFGAYADDDLSRRLAAIKPHLAWFPAQWPETYCYALSACLQAGLPIVATNLGAFPERLAQRPWSWIRPWQTGTAVWNDFFVALRKQYFASDLSPPVLSGAVPTVDFDYPFDYLQPPADASGRPAHIPDGLATLFHTCAVIAPPAEQDCTAWLQLEKITAKNLDEVVFHQPEEIVPANRSALAQDILSLSDGHPLLDLPHFNPSRHLKSFIEAFNPRVTVIVPNYNHSQFLNKRLDSIYQQTYKNFNVILLDDASSDNSRAILNEYAGHYSEITKTFFNEKNSGSTFLQWKKGIELADSDIVWIAESDDFCDKNFLEVLVPFFMDEAVYLAYAKSVFIGIDNQPVTFSFDHYLSEIDSKKWLADYVEFAHNEVVNALGKKNTIPNVSSVLFRKPQNCSLFMDDFWLNMKICGDWVFYLYLIRGAKLGFTNRTLNYFRFHSANSSAKTYQKSIYYEEHEHVARTIAKLYKVPDETLDIHQKFVKRFWEHNKNYLDPSGFDKLYDFDRVMESKQKRLPNILMASYAFSTGGGEIFPIRLANKLKLIGYGVTFFNFNQEPLNSNVRKMLSNDIPVYEYTGWIGNLDKLLIDFGIEIVHTHHASTEHFFATYMKERKIIKHIATMHGMYEMLEKIHIDNNLPVIIKSVDTWVYIAEKNLELFKIYNCYNEKKFIKIANGMEPPVIRSVERRCLGIPDNAFVLCLASRAMPEKGWREAIKIISEARALCRKDIHLLLLGDGLEYESLLLQEIPEYIHVLGFKNNPVDYYAMSDMGFLPSRFSGESFPLSIIECLFSKRPVIASDIGEIHNILTLKEGMAGATFSLHDWEIPVTEAAALVAEFVINPETYEKSRSLSFKAASRFHIDNVVKEYEKIYKNLYSSINPLDYETAVARANLQLPPYVAYEAWLRRHCWDEPACHHLLGLAQKRAVLPLIHLLIVLPAAQSALLGPTLIALARQTLAAWRLTVIADFACPSPEFAQMDELAWVTINTWEELSDVLAEQARQSPAEWFWCGQAGVQWEPVFINLAVELISRHPQWRLAYTDEDVVAQGSDQESWSRPLFKPDANLDLLRSSGYIGHAVLVHRALWESLPVVELRPGLLLNYAAALRCFEYFGEAAVGHVDEMVFHRPETAPVDWLAFGRDALPLLREHLQRQNLPATVSAGPLPGTFQVNYRLTQTPLVSIIIPTRNRLDLIQACLDSLLAGTRYPRFEVLVMDNRSDEPAVLDYLQTQAGRDARVRVIPYPAEYNYSAINNHAARLAQGEFLLLLNNDTVILQEDWLDTLVTIGLRPDVGAVGCRLIYPNHSVQHAGIIVGLGGGADHIGIGLPLGKPGYMGRAQLSQNFSAVTAACLLVRRGVFLEVDGLDEQDFAVLFNDVDFCLKLGARGYRIVWTPAVTLIHQGSSTLQASADAGRLARSRREQFALIEKWRARLIHDPAYNRHLSLRYRDWRVDEAMDGAWHPEFDPLPRVVALPCDTAGVGHYRTIGPVSALTSQGRIRSLLLPDRHHPRWFMPEPVELSRLKAQVLLVQNAFTDQQLSALEIYARLNPDLFTVFGLDDLVFALPPHNPARQQVGKDIKTRLRRGLARCDRAVVTSEPLAEALRGLIADIRVVPNYLDRARWIGLNIPRREHRKPRVGWAGGIHHAGDLAVLQPVIEATAVEVDWIFMGLCLKQARPYVAEVHPGVPFDAYPAALAALDLDLAVAPLELNRFNQAKSNLRLLEYGVLGWPVVCTDLLPYQKAPVTRTPNNPAAWIRAIREHVNDPEASKAAGAELQNWVLNYWLLDQHLDDWLGALLPDTLK